MPQTYTVEVLMPLAGGTDKTYMYGLKKEIHQRLEKKCFIVLDDVREQEVYFHIHDALQNFQGRCIVITTRNEHVAMISSPTGRLQLEQLSQPDAFDLLCRRAFTETTATCAPRSLRQLLLL